jgi:uncharacterized tellurite resistance protein B-like protein
MICSGYPKKRIRPSTNILPSYKVKFMGIFDKLRGSKNIQLTPKSALITAAITVIASDGVLDEAELGDLAKIARGDKNAVNDAVQVLQGGSLQEAMDLVTNCLNEKQRMSAMAILLDLAMADGILAGNEQKILQQYMEKFGISEVAIKPVVDAIALKNDFSVFS